MKKKHRRSSPEIEDLDKDPTDRRHDRLIDRHDLKQGALVSTGDKEYRKTYDEVFNDSTLKTIYRLFQRRVLDSLEHPISTGKEANVFLGYVIEKTHVDIEAPQSNGPAAMPESNEPQDGGVEGGDEPQDLIDDADEGSQNEPDESGKVRVAVKIFRESTTTFRKVRPYIEGDPRFKQIMKGRRGIVSIWTKKEFKNLKRMENAGVRVPSPHAVDRNILIMDYLGNEIKPALTLRQWCLEHRYDDNFHHRISKLCDEIIEEMRKINVDAGLVHSDLSEFNILIFNDLPYIIDVGQAVVHSHPMSGEFFERDVRNIAAFFSKMGVEITPKSILEKIAQ
jgi:RIO kinase 1